MLMKDFLAEHTQDLIDAEVVFDWYFPDTTSNQRIINYQLKVIDSRRVSYRKKLIGPPDGREMGEWIPSTIAGLRKFSIQVVSAPRKKLFGKPMITIWTDNP